MVWAIRLLGSIVFSSGAFDRIVAAVRRWAEKEFDAEMPRAAKNAARRNGVLQEIDGPMALGIGENLARLGVELALSLVKRIG
jgi:hypothetical protein